MKTIYTVLENVAYSFELTSFESRSLAAKYMKTVLEQLDVEPQDMAQYLKDGWDDETGDRVEIIKHSLRSTSDRPASAANTVRYSFE